LKSASRADRRAAACALALLAVAPVVWLEARAAQRARGPAAAPAWIACAGLGAGATIEPVRRLPALAEKALVEKTVARVFAQREKEQRVSAPNLASARLSIDFLYAAGQGPTRTYYYEASKTIPDAEGILRVSVAGWVGGDGAAQRTLGSKSELHWAELPGADDDDPTAIPEPATIPDPTAALVPLGVLARGGEHTWVMRRQIGRGTTLVYDIGTSGVRLRPAACTS
jgi:hypothetical protein